MQLKQCNILCQCLVPPYSDMWIIIWLICFVLCLGVKPYACTMCDMRFIQRYQLERHSLTHTGTSFLINCWHFFLALSWVVAWSQYWLVYGCVKLEFVLLSIHALDQIPPDQAASAVSSSSTKTAALLLYIKLWIGMSLTHNGNAYCLKL